MTYKKELGVLILVFGAVSGGDLVFGECTESAETEQSRFLIATGSGPTRGQACINDKGKWHIGASGQVSCHSFRICHFA